MGDLFSKSHRHRADSQTRAIRKLNEKEMPLSARAQLATKYAIKPYNCGVAIKNESHKVLRNETRCDKNQIKLPTGKKAPVQLSFILSPLVGSAVGPTYGNEETCYRSSLFFPSEVEINRDDFFERFEKSNSKQKCVLFPLVSRD